MTASAKPKPKAGDYVVKDIALAAWGPFLTQVRC